MTKKTRTFGGKNISASFVSPAGAAILSGAGLIDGDWLTITTGEDGFAEAPGADGSQDRIALADKPIVVAIKFKKTAPVNDILTVIHELDKKTNIGIGALSIVDTNGTMFLLSSQAYIMKKADLTVGTGMPEIEWSWVANYSEYNPGSNL